MNCKINIMNINQIISIISNISKIMESTKYILFYFMSIGKTNVSSPLS